MIELLIDKEESRLLIINGKIYPDELFIAIEFIKEHFTAFVELQ